MAHSLRPISLQNRECFNLQQDYVEEPFKSWWQRAWARTRRRHCPQSLSHGDPSLPVQLPSLKSYITTPIAPVTEDQVFTWICRGRSQPPWHTQYSSKCSFPLPWTSLLEAVSSAIVAYPLMHKCVQDPWGIFWSGRGKHSNAWCLKEHHFSDQILAFVLNNWVPTLKAVPWVFSAN